jgi:hypothetical protein
MLLHLARVVLEAAAIAPVCLLTHPVTIACIAERVIAVAVTRTVARIGLIGTLTIRASRPRILPASLAIHVRRRMSGNRLAGTPWNDWAAR